MSSNNNTSNKRKRPYSRQRNPPRGGPGILWTCETGRERKCLHQGLEMLQGVVATVENDEDNKKKTEQKMSLEEEISALKKQKNGDCPFSLYETGCRGTVFVLCTLPGCNLIPPIQSTSSAKKAREQEQQGESEGESKRQRTLEDAVEEDGDRKQEPKDTANSSRHDDEILSSPCVWDPLETVRTIITDLQQTQQHDDTKVSSRFVTRMIPIQATCFVDAFEIAQTVDWLLKRLLKTIPAAPAEYTFSIQPKRRNCSILNSKEIIECVADQVVQTTSTSPMSKPWKVDLRQPDFTIQVEICKTLCGVSIFSKSYLSFVRNFNLAEIRSRVGVVASE